jgi:IS5 family transposase
MSENRYHGGGNQYPLSDRQHVVGRRRQVLIRTMKQVTKIAGVVGTKLRDRSRSVKLRLLEISRTARAKGPLNHAKLKEGYRKLLN